MALIRTLTISTTTVERTKERFNVFRQTVQVDFMNFMKKGKFWGKIFNFFPVLNEYKNRTWTNCDIHNSEGLDLHLITRSILKKLFTD